MPEAALLGSHEERLAGLWRAAAEGRLPHALLFSGPAGIGKYAAARRLAQGLLCREGPRAEGPCGACGACQRAASGNHLDLFPLDLSADDGPRGAREERIKLERIVRREAPAWDGPVVEEFLGLRSAEGGWRIVIVREAERLAHSQNEAQNAMLKMLEEPGEMVLWILETARPAKLLATVRSRCVEVALEPLGQQDTLAVLARHGRAGEEARRLARWSRGAPGRALAYGERGALAFRPLIEEVLAGRRSGLGSARDVWEVEGEFPGKTPSAREREQARAFLDLTLEVVADRARLAVGAPADTLAHGDLEPDAGRPDEGRACTALEELLAARADLERNLSAQAVVDAGLLALAPLGRAAAAGGARR